MDKPHEYQAIEWVKISRSDKIFHSLIEVQDSLKSKNQKINLISYFAEWCPNCHYEALTLRDLYQEFSTFAIKMTLVMNYSDKKQSRDFVELYDLKMNILFGELNSKQESKLDQLIFTQFRRMNDDLRKWGTPFHIIILNGNIEKIGIVKGEFILKEIKGFLTDKLIT